MKEADWEISQLLVNIFFIICILNISYEFNYRFIGCSFGTIIGLPLCGVLCENYGWKINFIAIGIFALIMGLGFLQFGYDSPAKHPKISNEEKFYIQSSLGQIVKLKVCFFLIDMK